MDNSNIPLSLTLEMLHHVVEKLPHNIVSKTDTQKTLQWTLCTMMSQDLMPMRNPDYSSHRLHRLGKFQQ